MIDNTQQAIAPLRTNEELRFIAFQMATKYLMQRPSKEHPLTKIIEGVLIKMRDECDAERATLHVRIAELEQVMPPPAVLDAMDRLLDRLVGMFGDDANTMPEQLLDDYLTARAWVEEQPIW